MPFSKLQAGCHVPFTEEWLPSGHCTIKAWLVECCRDGCPSGRFSNLHRGTLELCQSDHQVLGHLPDQGPSPPNAQFGRAATLRVPFKNDGGHCVLGDLQWYRSVLVPFPRSVPWYNMSQSSTENSFDIMARFLVWHALSTVGPYIDRCVPFQIMSNQLNLLQVDSNYIVETSQGWSMERGCPWAQFFESHNKMSEYLCK